MRVQLRYIFLFVISLLSSRIAAADATLWTPETLPMVHLQDAHKWVCNPDGILSPAIVDSVDNIINHLNQEKGIEAVVVVVKRVEGGDCYTFGMDLSRKYGIGSKNYNTGLIVILSTEDRAYQILTGTGLEGTLPDAICKRIEIRKMIPKMKQQDWDYAILEGMKAIAQYIDGDDSLLKDNKNDDAEGGWAAIFFMFFFTFALFYLLILSRYRTCPNCGKKRFYATQQTYLYTQKRTDYYRVTYICSHCKHTENKIERRPHQDDDNAGGAILGGTILGSGMRGGGFGGSFGGGSFGGGSFGGGGAGGHF